MKSEFVFGLENAGWPVLLVDSKARIVRANPSATRLFGLGNDLEEPPLSLIWSPQNATSPEKFLDQWERSPETSTRVRFRARLGEPDLFTVSICAVFRGGEKLFVLQVLPQNASRPADEKRSESDTSILHKQKLDCALQLARTVALDFNNALTSILGHSSLVLSKMEPEHPWRESLLEVEKSAAKAAEIANDLGTFSQQDKARGQPAGNLNAVLQRTVEFFQQTPQAAQVQWSVLLEPKLFGAKFEEAKMQQALVKIIENAVQSLINGSGRISLQTRNVELAERAQDRSVQLAPGAYVNVEISDNGRGIPPDVLPRIFEPFFSTKGAAHRGLGLAWVYGVVTNQGGGVAISSQPGSGTSVRLYLPAESHTVTDHPTELLDLRGTHTVLFVDDEDMLLRMGRTILSTYGYQVLTANSGQKALEMLASEKRIDLVITDLVMPSMSGRELVEHIQQQWPNLPVLCTSGYVWQTPQDQQGAYLQKPFTSQELLLKVKKMLSQG